MIDDVTLVKYQLHTSVFILNLGTKCGNWIRTDLLMNIDIHIINVRVKFFMTMPFSSHKDKRYVTR